MAWRLWCWDACWARLNIKTVFARYVDSHVKDKTVARPSYLNGDAYTVKTTSLYWDDARVRVFCLIASRWTDDDIRFYGIMIPIILFTKCHIVTYDSTIAFNKVGFVYSLLYSIGKMVVSLITTEKEARSGFVKCDKTRNANACHKCPEFLILTLSQFSSSLHSRLGKHHSIPCFVIHYPCEIKCPGLITPCMWVHIFKHG